MNTVAASPSHFIYIGTSTSDKPGGSRGIYALQLDGATGRLSTPALAAAAREPGFLALSPDRRHLYAVVSLETRVDGMDGGVQAFAIDAASGALTRLNEQPTGGEHALHLTVDQTGRSLVVANYISGTLSALPVLADGRVGERTSLVQLTGTSPAKPKRQDKPYPHSVAVSPDNRYVFVPALGQDKIVQLKLEAATATLTPGNLAAYATAPGAGPRHAVFSGDGKFYYCLNELDGTVDVLAYDAADGKLTPVQTISGLPADFTGENTSAEIRVHPNGRFLYTSNRGHDSLAVFAREAASGRLTRVEIVPCGGGHPRNFALSPDGAWLVCANRDANNLVVFAVDATSGRLTRTGEEAKVPMPICVLFWK